jgi:ABC-type bacteriocin/lantibiotic exporter with double-glycine peptidase domain
MPTIKVKEVKQKNTNWCWAACCEMFSTYYDGKQTQDEFVNAFNKKFQHGLNAKATYSETGWVLANSPKKLLTTATMKSITWAEVNAYILKNKLIIASRKNHAIIIVGTDTNVINGDMLLVRDPNPGTSTGPLKMSYVEFKKDWVASVIKS